MLRLHHFRVRIRMCDWTKTIRIPLDGGYCLMLPYLKLVTPSCHVQLTEILERKMDAKRQNLGGKLHSLICDLASLNVTVFINNLTKKIAIVNRCWRKRQISCTLSWNKMNIFAVDVFVAIEKKPRRFHSNEGNWWTVVISCWLFN